MPQESEGTLLIKSENDGLRFDYDQEKLEQLTENVIAKSGINDFVADFNMIFAKGYLIFQQNTVNKSYLKGFNE